MHTLTSNFHLKFYLLRNVWPPLSIMTLPVLLANQTIFLMVLVTYLTHVRVRSLPSLHPHARVQGPAADLPRSALSSQAQHSGWCLVGTQWEKAMAPHSSTVARKIPWMEEPGGLQSMGSLRVRHDWVTSLSLSTFMHWRRKWQPTPVSLPGESHGRRSLVGCSPWGCTESDMTEATWQVPNKCVLKIEWLLSSAFLAMSLSCSQHESCHLVLLREMPSKPDDLESQLPPAPGPCKSLRVTQAQPVWLPAG